MVFKSRRPGNTNGSALWKHLCRAEISDLLTLQTEHPGGGGFLEDQFYVEGLHYTVRPGPPDVPDRRAVAGRVAAGRITRRNPFDEDDDPVSPAPHPRMHGLTHVPGGPDPIPGLVATRAALATTDAASVGIAARTAFWKLDETVRHVAAFRLVPATATTLTAPAFATPVLGQRAGAARRHQPADVRRAHRRRRHRALRVQRSAGDHQRLHRRSCWVNPRPTCPRGDATASDPATRSSGFAAGRLA